MRTLLSSPIVSTSPALTASPGAFSRTPLMRTWPASTSAAALVRAFTTRACHNHLSRRWRSKQVQRSTRLTILAAGGELLLERRQLCEWRIGIDRTIAFARGGGGGELPMRRPAVAAALVTATA